MMRSIACAKLDLDEEVGTAQLGKMDADMAMLKRPGKRRQKDRPMGSGSRVLSARSARLTDELAQVPKSALDTSRAWRGSGLNSRRSRVRASTFVRRARGQPNPACWGISRAQGAHRGRGR